MRSRFGLRWVMLAATSAMLLGGGVAAAAGGGGKAIPAPEGLPDFYAVPQPLPKKPGTLIKSQRVRAKGVHGTVFRVMYVSESQQGKPRAVTGVIVVPDTDPPKGGYPVVSWAHGTTGIADECAPSLDAADAAAEANAFLDRGWLFAATDYEGQGTPGMHPYIAGKNAARNTVDMVRAARNLRKAHASRDYVVWGHSQGGHTAMHALELGHDYAPELDLHGVVAGAPPSQFNLIYTFLRTSSYRHYLLMAAGGLNAAYGDEDAPLDEVLTPKGIDLLSSLEDGCSGALQRRFADVPFEEVTKADPFSVPKWRAILSDEDPTNFLEPVDTPLLIIHGGADEQIPTASSAILRDDLCQNGQALERWVYPDQSHAGVIVPSLGDMVAWMEARFAGEDPGSTLPAAGVEITGCASS